MTATLNSAVDRMKRELWSDLAAMVAVGDLTDTEANEWFDMKCEQWKGGIS